MWGGLCVSLTERALNEIENGRAGNNVGIPFSLRKLNEFVPGIQKGAYYLFGAFTKEGKSTLTRQMFIYDVWDYVKLHPEVTVDIDLYAFEETAEIIIILGVSRRLWQQYGIIADVDTILSRGTKKCEDWLYELILKELKYFEGIEDILTIHSVDNPTGISKYLYNKALSHGTIIQKNIQQDPEAMPIYRFDRYVPHNPNRYWIIMIDHIGLTLQESGKSMKEIIDDLSKKVVQIRNNFGATIVIIQQLTFDTVNDDRFKSKRLTPTLADFSDSKFTTRDCTYCLALFSPARVELSTFHGYDIKRLGNSFRNLEILASRSGEANINLGLNFIGKTSVIRELPRADQMTDLAYKHASEYINGASKYIKNDRGVYVKRNE